MTNGSGEEASSPLPGRAVAVLALPGALGWWLTARVNAAAAAAGLRPNVHTVGQFDTDFGPPLQPGELRIYLAPAPSPAFCAELSTGRIPALMALTDLDGALAEIAAADSTDRLKPLRDASASLAVLNRVRDLPGASVLILDDEGPAETLMSAAARQFALPPEAFLVGMPQGRGDEEPVDDAIHRDGGPDRRALRIQGRLDEATSKAAHYALMSMMTRLRGESGYDKIAWQHDLLFSGDEIGAPARLIVDLTGPARVLYYGPYLHLPDGEWTLSAILGFPDDTDGVTFTLELLRAHHVIASGWLRPDRRGLFKVEFPVSIDCAEHPLEVRLHSNSGAIGGKAGLALVSFSPGQA